MGRVLAAAGLSPQGAVRHGPAPRPPWVLALPALATALLAAVPLVYIFLRALDGGWTGYAEVVGSRRAAQLIGRTLWLAAGVAAASTALALPLAWLVTRTDLAGRRVWAVIAALPLVFPSYVAAYCWVAVFGPRGYLQGWLEVFGVERLGDFAYGYPGALATLTLFNFPYLYLILVSALQRLDPALEESSRSLGAGRRRTFVRILLPQLTPAIASGLLLVVLYTLSDFGAVSITGYNTFTLAIYNAFSTLYDRTAAASLATLLVLLTAVFVLAEMSLHRRFRPRPAAPPRRQPPVRLGPWSWLAQTALGLLALLSLGVPIGVTGYWGVRAIAAGNPLGSAGSAALGSLAVSLPTALVAIVLAVPVAVWSVRYPGLAARCVTGLASSGTALPGLVVALSLVFLATRSLPALYQTPLLLVAAYLVRFLPQAVAAVRAALAAVSPRLEEAARALGRGPLAVLGSVTLPLVRSGLAAGAGLVFLTSMKELPATLLLRPIGFETLATRIWSTASEGIYSQAALPALLLVAVSALPVYGLIIRPALAGRPG